MNWLTNILKYIAKNPWIWTLLPQANKYIIKPIIDKFKKKKDG